MCFSSIIELLFFFFFPRWKWLPEYSPHYWGWTDCFWSPDGCKGSLWVKRHCGAWVRSSNIWIGTVSATLGVSVHVVLCHLIGFHLSIRTWLINQYQQKKSSHMRRGANPQLWLAVGPTHTCQEQQTVDYIYIHMCVHVWHESTGEKQSKPTRDLCWTSWHCRFLCILQS